MRPKIFVQENEKSLTWGEIYPDLEKTALNIQKWKDMPGSKVYEKRLYDIVLDNSEATLTPKEKVYNFLLIFNLQIFLEISHWFIIFWLRVNK